MVGVLLAVGILVAAFVGFNIGGSSTRRSWSGSRSPSRRGHCSSSIGPARSRGRDWEETTPREVFGTVLVVGIGCYMAFAAGASNVTNAVVSSTVVTALSAIGEERSEDIPAADELFEPKTTARVVLMQNLVPSIASIAAFLMFRFTPIA